ncbi:MAG: molybdopterin-dependent oxidoreductase [Thermoprotei archaeon]
MRLTRRDFLKLSAITGAAVAASLAVTKDFGFDIFAAQTNYEQLPPGWQYSYVPSTCGICSSICDILVTVEQNGTYIRGREIDGNPLSTLNHGKLCARGRSGLQITYNKDRIKKPLIRTGPKGTWAFREAEWPEAIQYIMQKLQELNVKPWEMMLMGGAIPCANYRPEFIPFNFASQIPTMVGSPMQPCLFGEHMGMNITIGTFDIHGDELADDFENSSLIVIWGNNGNPTGVFVNKGSRFGKGLAKGAYVVVLDPRQSESASKADLWIPVKPGSDLAVAMGLIKYLIENGYYDDYFVRYHTNAPFLVYQENGYYVPYASYHSDGTVKGFYVYDEITNQIVEVPPFSHTNAYSTSGQRIVPALRVSNLSTPDGKQLVTVFQALEQIVSHFTIDYVAQIADVDKSLLEEFYFRVGTMRPIDIASGQKGQQGNYTTMWRKAIGIIMALTGNIDVKGGWIYSGGHREGAILLYETYKNMVSSGQVKPGIVIQRPEVLMSIPTLKLPGQMMQYFATVFAFCNPKFWNHGYPAVWCAYNQNLTSQGLKPAAAFSLFPDTGVYEAYKGQLTWNGSPYKIKAILTCCVNPAKDFQEDEWREVLSNSFVVMVDVFPTDTALYADVILPDASYPEREDPITERGATPDSGYRKRFQAVPRVYPYSVPNLDILAILAYEMGFLDKYAAWIANVLGMPADQFAQILKEEVAKNAQYLMKNGTYPRVGGAVTKAMDAILSQQVAEELGVTPDEVMNQLKKNGVITTKTYDDFVKEGKRIPWDTAAGTPTGRIEIYSMILYYYVIQNFGYDPTWDPILAYVPPLWNGGYAVTPGKFVEPPAPYNDPTFKPTPPEFFYIEFKVPMIAYTYTANVPILEAISSNSYHAHIYQRAWINKSVAKQLGINEGDWIVIESKLNGAKLVMRAHLTEWIRPDTIGVPEPWGQASPGLSYATRALKNFGNRAVTTLWPKSYDPLTGHRMVQQFTVTVRKATQDEVSQYTQTAPAQTPDTLPANSNVQPDFSVPSNSTSVGGS